jgi:putative ABC transport system substrate-binding protein
MNIRPASIGVGATEIPPRPTIQRKHSTDYLDLYRRAASYVDKILTGANAADLPIEQPTKFELIVNLKTAKSLGLTISESCLLRADQVTK